MNQDGQVYMDFDGGKDTLEDRMRLIEAERAEAKQRAEDRFTRAMEEYYEKVDRGED